MLPMGTIVTGCMIAGLILATELPVFKSVKKLPARFRKSVGFMVFLAGFWNVFWYAVQHIGEFWGIAALISGILLMLTSIYIVETNRIPSWLIRGRPVVLLLMLSCALLYGITIYNL